MAEADIPFPLLCKRPMIARYSGKLSGSRRRGGVSERFVWDIRLSWIAFESFEVSSTQLRWDCRWTTYCGSRGLKY